MRCAVYCALQCRVYGLRWCFVRAGTYTVHDRLNSDDLENSFADKTARAGGYMSSAKKFGEATKAAERETHARATVPENVFVMFDKRKRRTGVSKAHRLDDWDDGERLPPWFPDSRFPVGGGDVTDEGERKKRKVKVERRMAQVGARRASGTQTAIREFHVASGRV